MLITWLGHSCFLLESEGGTRLLMDPPDPDTGYAIEPQTVDAVSASHSHHDHANFALAPDARRIITPGSFTVGDMALTGFVTYHDKEQGRLRGENIMYRVEADGLRLLHAGDLGAMPDEATCRAIGKVDVLLTPIGGVYTIGPDEALALCNLLHPKVVVPMHYRTADCNINLGELMPFLNNARNCAIHRTRQAEITISPETLGSDRIVVLDYVRSEKE